MRISVFIFIVLGLFGCKKDEVKVDFISISSPVNERIRAVERIDNQLIFCGGEFEGKGFILTSDLQLNTIDLKLSNLQYPLYDVKLYNNRYVFGTRRAQIAFATKTLDYFNVHNPKKENWVIEHNKTPIREIAISHDSSLLIGAGGAKFQFGVILSSKDSTKSWKPNEQDNELRAACFTEDNTCWVGGFGFLKKLKNKSTDWEWVKMNRVFINSIDFYNANNGVLCTFNGEIYKTIDAGNTWKKKENGSSLKLNKIRYINETTLVSVGQNGAFCISKDSGETWKCGSSMNGTHLLDLERLTDSEIVVVGTNGNIYKVFL